MNVIEGSLDQGRTDRPAFWARQFAAEATTPQLVFDVVFGIVAPVLCFALDPIVFRGGLSGRPLLADYQAFAYLLSAFEIAVLGLWLMLGARLHRWNTFVGGILIGGAIFCAVLGLLLSPYSLLGLMLLIGALGFTPFLTAIVYLRNGYRAIHSTQHPRPLSVTPFLLGCLLALGGPALISTAINQTVNHSVETILHGDPRQASIAARRLRPISFLGTSALDRVVNEYSKETNAVRRERLKASYMEATGEDLETKLRIIND